MTVSSTEPVLWRSARVLAFASAVAVLFSIAACQILLGLALATLLFSGMKLRFPAVWLPLGLFVFGTLVSLAFSENPAAGLPQVRKIFVFSMLLVIVSTMRDLASVRRLFLCWIAAGALVALRGLVQFGEKYHQARLLGRSFYEYYVADRITGFMSHWMTFGGLEMFVLLILAAYLFFAPQAGKRGLWFWLACGAIIGSALLLGFTRNIWLALAVGGLYLTWQWRRVFVLLAPLAMVVLLGVTPVRARFASMFEPRKDVDSNQHRIVSWRTGWEMVRAHPWFGLGPQEVNLRFYDYVPADVPRPLPHGWYGHLHNLYLHYAAERGVPAMLALVWMLLRIVFDFVRAIRKLPPGRSDTRFILQGGVAIVLATMVAGIFELNLGDSEVLTLFLALVGCGYVALEYAQGTVAQEKQAIA